MSVMCVCRVIKQSCMKHHGLIVWIQDKSNVRARLRLHVEAGHVHSQSCSQALGTCSVFLSVRARKGPDAWPRPQRFANANCTVDRQPVSIIHASGARRVVPF